MIKYSRVNLPDTFARLLRMDISDSERGMRLLRSYIKKDESLSLLMESCFRDIDEDIDVVLNSLGWFGVRNRLGAIYLHYHSAGDFFVDWSQDYCQEILELERQLFPFVTSGNSRSFLLGFYWLMSGHKIILTPELMELLKFARAKIVQIDWVVAMALHLIEYLGLEAVKGGLEDGIEYDDFVDFLSQEQRQEMIGNLLSYAYSVGDSDLFINDKI